MEEAYSLVYNPNVNVQNVYNNTGVQKWKKRSIVMRHGMMDLVKEAESMT